MSLRTGFKQIFYATVYFCTKSPLHEYKNTVGALQLGCLEGGIRQGRKKRRVSNLGPPIEAGESCRTCNENQSGSRPRAGIPVLSLSPARVSMTAIVNELS